MSFKKTGRLIEQKPREESHLVCDQCGKEIGKPHGRADPHFEVRWEAEVGYDDEGFNSWQADICSVECLKAYAEAGAPPVERNY